MKFICGLLLPLGCIAASAQTDADAGGARAYLETKHHEHTVTGRETIGAFRREFGNIVSKVMDKDLAFHGCNVTASTSDQLAQRAPNGKESGYRQTSHASFPVAEVHVVARRGNLIYLYFQQQPSKLVHVSADEVSETGFADFHSVSQTDQTGNVVYILAVPHKPGPATMDAVQAAWIAVAYACGAPAVEAQQFDTQP